MAGAPGFEPGITGPKPAALPLGYAPTRTGSVAVDLAAVAEEHDQRDGGERSPRARSRPACRSRTTQRSGRARRAPARPPRSRRRLARPCRGPRSGRRGRRSRRRPARRRTSAPPPAITSKTTRIASTTAIQNGDPQAVARAASGRRGSRGARATTGWSIGGQPYQAGSRRSRSRPAGRERARAQSRRRAASAKRP